MSIKYIRLVKYFKFDKSNIQQTNDVNKLIFECDSTEKGSVFEILWNDTRRLYFDIENIPKKDNYLIYQIINKLSNFLDIDSEQVTITKNTGSHHGGLSYHIYFPYASTKDNIYNIVRQFKAQYPNYKEYIDETVYTKNRLFRLPNQPGIVKLQQLNDIPSDLTFVLNDNTHKIIKGDFASTIIQNIKQLPVLKKQFGEDVQLLNQQIDNIPEQISQEDLEELYQQRLTQIQKQIKQINDVLKKLQPKQ